MLEFAPRALLVVTIFRAITAFFAATTRLVQNDIKRVIAYSTCSQLRYIVIACRLSQYSIRVFHLINHAFFKALLFLGAGSVIHALRDEQDIRKLRRTVKLLPITYSFIVIRSLALVRFPFLTRFYSKDAILEIAYSRYTIQRSFAY
jgi:NADH-ubiquinone oxidoreductase chain 5